MNLDATQGETPRRGKLFLLFAVTVAVCLTALAINRGPLYYFDTGSYFKQGDAALSLVLPENQSAREDTASDFRDAGAAAEDDDSTSGSRSMLYALLVAAFWRVDALGGVALVNLAGVLLASWLAARAAGRVAPSGPGTTKRMAIPLLVAATTSLPFYVAYVMPDIFAPVMLLLIATVVAMFRDMQPVERLAALALAAFAVLLHPSHLAIAGLMLPFVLLAALSGRARVSWLSVGFVACLVLVGVAERKTFEFAAETVARKDVTYTPHMTARLIVDGPGMDYLEENCPRPDLATCSLYEALSWSDDPYRLTASHIIFERSPELGSFRLMSDADQKAVAGEQREFFFRVLSGKPFATIRALALNAAEQLTMNSVRMTVPTEAVKSNVKSMSGLSDERLGVLEDGILARDRSWIETADVIHSTIYLLSFLVVAALLLWPGRLAPPLKVFGLFILVGIALNALVCGGISQPADRYGARVMWLLPFAAAFLSLAAAAPRTATGGDP